MTLEDVNSNTEKKIILVFSVAIWFVYFGINFAIELTKGYRLPQFSGVLIATVGTTITWFFARKLRTASLLPIVILGPVIAVVAEVTSMEIRNTIIKGVNTWNFDDFNMIHYVRETMFGSYLYLTWYFGYFVITHYFKFARESLAAAEARSQANEAQLEMLRYQINPHLLFNTLNSISALVLDKNNEKAEDMIGSLSRFLRFSLDRVPNVKTRLEDEVAMIKEYLSIEEIRFSDKLSIQYDIDPKTLDCLVPSLILQPAIENAIKHGIRPLKTGGKIAVRSKIKDGHLQFCIADSGKGVTAPTKHGVGMRNIQDRLNVIYGDAGKIGLQNDKELGGALACLEIPVEFKRGDKSDGNPNGEEVA